MDEHRISGTKWRALRRPGGGKCVMVALLCALLGPRTGHAAPVSAPPFGFRNVEKIASDLAAKPYRKVPQKIPQFLLKLTYNQYRDIRFKPSAALWRKEGLPFEVEFFHPGFYYNQSVQINIIDRGGVHRLPFSTAFFDYGKNRFPQPIPPDIGYAGFRIHYPINTRNYHDEVAAFLGASYFRAVAKGEVYGLSARGLAIDTALPKGEEFPYFREFWLRKPGPQARSMTIYALLDSPSLTGAYRFDIHPGTSTVMQVQTTLYLRKQVGVLGFAPLTSMFFHGSNTRRCFNDFRPQVHDSDGLLMHNGDGEWIWRPLVNPRELLVNTFSFDHLAGFGLLQRDRDFHDYQDLEARYDLRPSLWVQPKGHWGPGRVELVQIPTVDEKHDNIVAFWTPNAPLPAPDVPIPLAYTLSWFTKAAGRPPGGYVSATRLVAARAPHVTKFILDFAGGTLQGLPANAPVQPVITVGPNGKLVNSQIEKNVVTGGWRVVFRILHAHDKPVELRCFLKDEKADVLTETWSYLLTP